MDTRQPRRSTGARPHARLTRSPHAPEHARVRKREGDMTTTIKTAVLAAVAIAAATPAFAQGKWSSLKPIPQGEEEVYGTTAGGKLYVLGGLGIFPGWEPN